VEPDHFDLYARAYASADLATPADRRVGVRLSRAVRLLGCIAVPGMAPGAVGPAVIYASPPRLRTHSSAACSALSRRRRPTVTQFPVTRCQICQRTVACRPGALSQTLTDDYRRVHPERWASPPSNTRITRPGEGRTRSCP
jgi:hypothetical protein